MRAKVRDVKGCINSVFPEGSQYGYITETRAISNASREFKEAYLEHVNSDPYLKYIDSYEIDFLINLSGEIFE